MSQSQKRSHQPKSLKQLLKWKYFYHGSDSLPDNTVPDHTDESGIFLAPDKKFAGEFGSKVHKFKVDTSKILDARNPEHKKLLGGDIQLGSAGLPHAYDGSKSSLDNLTKLKQIATKYGFHGVHLHESDWPGTKTSVEVYSKDYLAKGAASRLAPFSPKKDEQGTARDWVVFMGGRDNLPRHEGSVRFRGINKLIAASKTRRGEGGEVEVLLHRGGSMDEANAWATNGIDTKTSWTPDIHQAKRFSDPHVISSWVPISKMHHFPFMEGYDPDVKHYRQEFEVVVDPHTLRDPVVRHHKEIEDKK